MITEKISEENKFEKVFGSKARLKILKVLSLNYELSISQIIKRSKLNHTSALKHLKYLKKKDLIQEKKFGRIKIYRYKIENIKAKSLKNFIEIWEGGA